MARRLLEEQAEIVVSDPKALENARLRPGRGRRARSATWKIRPAPPRGATRSPC
ncbi:MAG: hypothetical protein MZV70_67560 [Desulfobacterales bacterium]|nr:hypothetical protein [Desulfobacterales bacterium]